MKPLVKRRILKDEESLKCVTREKDLTTLGYHCLKKLVDYGFTEKNPDSSYKYERLWVWTNHSQYIIVCDICNTRCYVDIKMSSNMQCKIASMIALDKASK